MSLVYFNYLIYEYLNCLFIIGKTLVYKLSIVKFILLIILFFVICDTLVSKLNVVKFVIPVALLFS